MFINPAFAQEAAALAADPAAAAAPVRLLVQFGVIFAVFYLFLIRPQQMKFKEHVAMQNAIAKGDTVITAGGVIGEVVASDENELTVRIADGVQVRVIREKILMKKENSAEAGKIKQDNQPSGKKGAEGLKDVLTKK